MTQKNKEAGLKYWKNRRKGKIIKCKLCKKELYVSPYYINKKSYCSNKCKWKQMKEIRRTDKLKKQISDTMKRKGIKPKQIPWTNERRKKLSDSLKGRDIWNSGMKVRKGKYKYLTKNGVKKPISHWIWFDKFGYFPKKEFIIHHKNFDESDNKIENLQLVTRSEHLSIHNKINKLTQSKGKKRGEIIYKEFIFSKIKSNGGKNE